MVTVVKKRTIMYNKHIFIISVKVNSNSARNDETHVGWLKQVKSLVTRDK